MQDCKIRSKGNKDLFSKQRSLFLVFPPIEACLYKCGILFYEMTIQIQSFIFKELASSSDYPHVCICTHI